MELDLTWPDLGASCVHAHLGVFYAPRAEEGNQSLQINLFKSVEAIRGYTSRIRQNLSFVIIPLRKTIEL
jgi:hypothetical protein